MNSFVKETRRMLQDLDYGVAPDMHPTARTARVFVNFFVREARSISRMWTKDPTPDVHQMAKSVRASMKELKKMTERLHGMHKKMQAGGAEAEKTLGLASEDYLEAYGRVHMGREALRIAAYAERQLSGDLPAADRAEWEHRLMLTELAIRHFVSRTAPTHDIRFAATAPAIKAKMAEANAAMAPR